MNYRLFAMLIFTLTGLTCLIARAQSTAKTSPNSAKTSSATGTKASASEGEKLFTINCARCHNPPENISPREAAAVVRHMRVRAMLSAEDEKLILQFLAP